MDAIQERLAKTEEKMKKSIAALDNEYKSIRSDGGDQRAGGAFDGDSAVGSDYAERYSKGNPCF